MMSIEREFLAQIFKDGSIEHCSFLSQCLSHEEFLSLHEEFPVSPGLIVKNGRAPLSQRMKR